MHVDDFRFVWTRPDDGTTSVTGFAQSFLDKHGTPEAAMDVLLQRGAIVPDAGGVTLVDKTTVPTDRTFRDAWRHNAGLSHVDMPLARGIHMDRIRRARDLELTRLDKDWMRATGRRTPEAAAIEAEREVLRNLPQTFDLEQYLTPEDLAAAWPARLPNG